jgi:hypothetical protein
MVALSSTEAEYYALSETIKCSLYVRQILQFINEVPKYPTKVFVDNTGAMFMANNWSTNARTKHVDVKYHFIREYVENKTVEVIFVRTDANVADLFTKNLPKNKFLQHEGDIMQGKYDTVLTLTNREDVEQLSS